MTDRNLRGSQPLRLDELGDADEIERRAAMDAGRVLDTSIDEVSVRVPEDFTGRVMAAIAGEPVPGPVGFLTPLRRRGLVAGFGESVRRAWAAVGTAGMPSLARATALAYVLVVAIAGAGLAGVTALGVGSALGVFDLTTRTPAPTVTPAPTLAPAPTTEVPLPTPAPQTAPVETEEPDESDDHSGPDASDDSGGEIEQPGGDDGGNSGPGSSGDTSPSDDNSGSGSGSGSGPEETSTPRPTGTPKPSETPH